MGEENEGGDGEGERGLHGPIKKTEKRGVKMGWVCVNIFASSALSKDSD